MNMKRSDQIPMNPIGIIHSPYKSSDDVPRQAQKKGDVEAWVELNDEYVQGLRDLDGFSHCILLFYFHQSEKVTLEGSPPFDDETHGIFAIRSPHRPNHIGLSIVKINRIKDNNIFFTGVDMLQGTPLLDIKPYISHIDCIRDSCSGWVDKYDDMMK